MKLKEKKIPKKGLVKKSIPKNKKRFECQVCKKTFGRKENLKGHSRVHTGERPYKCDVCGSRFRNCSNLKEHRRIHTGERPYDCKVCGVSFLQVNHLRKHQKIHAREIKRHDCQICDSNFNDAEALELHIQDIHQLDEPLEKTIEEILQCSFCPKTFKYRHQFNEHIKSHSGGGCFRCDICGTGFAKVSDLDDHKANHSKLPTLKYQCHICSEYFEKFSILDDHLQDHVGSGKYFRCVYCTKSFTRKDNLIKHTAIHESSTGKAVVPIKMEKALEKSVAENESEETDASQVHKCGNCNREFNDALALELHIQDIHKLDDDDDDDDDYEEEEESEEDEDIVEKVFQCKFCFRVFRSRGYYIKHVKSHFEKSKFSCEICGSCFSDECDLEEHLKEHYKLSALKYQCHICSKNFTMFSTLEGHLQEHISKNDFPCEECNLDFKTEELFKKHSLTHKSPFQLPSGSTESIIKKKKKHSMKKEKHSITSLMKQGKGTLHLKHSGKRKSFRCEYCDRCFTMERIWLKHIKKHVVIQGNKQHLEEQKIEGDSAVKQQNESLLEQKPTPENVSEDEEAVDDFIPMPATENDTDSQVQKLIGEDSPSSVQAKTPSKTGNFKCQVCDRLFINKGHFIAHLRVHTGSSPEFLCKVCGKRFRKLGKFNKHRADHLKAVQNKAKENSPIKTKKKVIIPAKKDLPRKAKKKVQVKVEMT